MRSENPTWISRGIAVGVSLGIAEAILVVMTGLGVPFWYALAVFYFVAVCGTLVGLAIAAVCKLSGWNPGEDFARTIAPVAGGALFIFVWSLALDTAIRRGLPGWVGLLGAVVAAFGLALMVGWIGSRVLKARAPSISLALGLLLLGTWLAAGRYFSRFFFSTYLTTGTIVTITFVTVMLILVWVVFDRLLAETTIEKRFDLRWWNVALLVLAPVVVLAVIQLHATQFPAPVVRDPGNRLEASGLPNVILISIDTLRADHLSAYGYPRNTSPALDRIAKDGVTHLNVLSPSSWTLPGHASIFTGKLPTRHGALIHVPPDRSTDDGAPGQASTPEASPLGGGHETLAEVLSQAGYRTAAFISNAAWMNREWGLDQGFDLYDDRPHIIFGHVSSFHRILRTFFRGINLKSYRTAEQLNLEIFPWLDRNHLRPFFLFVNYMDPHSPYSAPDPFYDAFFTDETPYLHQVFVKSSPLPTHFESRSKTKIERIHALYDGEVLYVSYEIGRLVDKLMELGLYADSLIILTSDHGEFLGEHKRIGHGYGPFDEVYRVPLIVKYPGSRITGKRRDLVQTTDIFPSVLELVGIDLPDNIDGSSLQGERGPIIIEQFIPPPGGGIERGIAGMVRNGSYGRCYRAIYEEPWKLLGFFDDTVQLHNLHEVPSEKHDHSEQLSDLTLRLLANLDRWAAEAQAAAPDPLEHQMDEEDIRRLRALGYF